MQSYRKLRVWERAHVLALRADAVSRRFPRTGYGWLATQLRRATESVTSNIVEGCAQRTGTEFARFLQMAIASATEAEHHVGHARDIGVLTAADAAEIEDELRQIQRMLVSLSARVRGDVRKTDNNSDN